ncbi:MAG: M14 family metallopeptidase [Bdellovibrionota bacterium]
MKSTFLRSMQIFFVLLWLTPAAFGIEFNRYHDQEEIAAYLRSEAQANPALASFRVLGKSQQGREIAIVTVTKSTNPEAPGIYFNGTHHGNERASTEAVLALLDYLVRQKDQPDVDKLLRRYRIILHPLVNPDGHALNLRTDSRGIDPNRDYETPTKSEKDAFQLVETRLVRDLLVKDRFVVASAAFHSGLEAVLWPWCHTPTLSQHDPVFRTLAGNVAKTMQVNRTSQSFYDYQTEGEFIDFAYMRHGIYALTFEVAHEAAPPAARLVATVKRAVQGSFSFIKAVDEVLSNPQLTTPVLTGDSQASL